MGPGEYLRAQECGCIHAKAGPLVVMTEATVVLPFCLDSSCLGSDARRRNRDRCECVVSGLRVSLPGICTEP